MLLSTASFALHSKQVALPLISGSCSPAIDPQGYKEMNFHIFVQARVRQKRCLDDRQQ